MVKTEEVCRWCLQPRTLCRESSCDSEPTFTGIRLDGRWVNIEEVGPTRPSGMPYAHHGPGDD